MSTGFGDEEECYTGCDTTTGGSGDPYVPMALAIHYANGAGGFSAPQYFDLDLGPDVIDSYPVALFVADLNGDEWADLLLYHSREILALAGSDSGEFTALDSVFADNLRHVVPAHNADRTAGVLVYDGQGASDERLLFHPWNGEGFDAEQAYVAPPQGALGSADLDGDGVADAIVGGRDELLADGVDVYTFMGIGGDAPVATEIYPNLVDSNLATAVQTGDLNGDGALDVVMTVDDHDYARVDSPVTGAVVVLRGDGEGAFAMPSATEFDHAPRELLVGDFDGSSGPDVLIRTGSGEMHAAFNDGTGLLSPSVAATACRGLFAVGRVNDDLRDDALVRLSELSVSVGEADGSFDQIDVGASWMDDRATLVDIDGDGLDDVVHVVRADT